MKDLEILLHHGLYEAAQKSYKGYICEINTNRYGDCVNVHLVLKGDSVLASVGKYRVGEDIDEFYKQMTVGLK